MREASSMPMRMPSKTYARASAFKKCASEKCMSPCNVYASQATTCNNHATSKKCASLQVPCQWKEDARFVPREGGVAVLR